MNHWALSAILFLIMVASGFTLNGIGLLGHTALPFDTAVSDVRQSWGSSDAGSYLQAALSLHDSGTIPEEDRWILNLWPPGMVWLNLALVTLSENFGIPFLVQSLFVNAWALAIVTTKIFTILVEKGRALWAGFITAFLLSSSITQFGTNYIGMSDSLAACLVVLSGIYLFEWVSLNEERVVSNRLLKAAFALGFAMYLRVTVDTFALLMVIFLLLWVATQWIIKFLVPRNAGRSPKRNVAGLAFVLGVSQLLTLPWRFFVGTVYRPGDFRWSTASDYYGPYKWIPTERFESWEAGWLIEGHANFACLNDPEQCHAINQDELLAESPFSGGPSGAYTTGEHNLLAIQSFLESPSPYVVERLSILAQGFVAPVGAPVGTVSAFETVALLLLFLPGLIMILRYPERLNSGLVFLLSFTILNVGFLALVHMETRYLLGVKLAMLVITALALPNRTDNATDSNFLARKGR